VTILSSLVSIDLAAFLGCSSLNDFYCYAKDAPRNDAFIDSNIANATLHVPEASISQYKATEPWNNFKEIVALKDESVPTLTLTLTATEKNGLVTLRFDAVPNDLRYRIIRTDANGTKAKVDSKEGNSYPATIEYVDNPPAGTYTYFAQTVCIDTEGNNKSLKSNEVTVTVEEAQTGEQEAQDYVTVYGSIECDKNMPTYGTKVRFSNDDVTTSVVGTNFMRSKVPVGTDVTLTVEGDDSHSYEPVTFRVEKMKRPDHRLVLLKGVLKEDYKPNEQEHDLAICSIFQLLVEDNEHHAKFTVKNLSSDNKWMGYVKAKAVRTKNRNWRKLANMIPTYIGQSNVIKIEAGGQADVKITFHGLELDEDTDFTFYLESVGKWVRDEDANDADVTKGLTCINGSSVSNIPFQLKIGKTNPNATKWDDKAREDFAYLMLGLLSNKAITYK